jgi:glycosyltransferase 2 family protein
MTAGAPPRVPQHRGWWRGPAVSLLVLALALALALRFVRLEELEQLLISADPWWLLAALASKLLVPFLTAVVYQATLRVLGYRLKIVPFWLVAQVAGFVNGALPAGPLVMSALLLRIFRQRGIPKGVTILAVTLDTLTYQIVFYGLFACGLGYVLVRGGLRVSAVDLTGPLVIGAMLTGGYLWLRRYDRARLTQALVQAQQVLARRLRRPWQAIAVEHFLGQLFRGVDLIRARPIVIGRLLAYQLGVILLDILTLYCAFRALKYAPPFIVVVLGATLASFITTLAPLPGGGGAFETTLVLVTTRVGVPVEVALGATLIYRVLAFWLPLLLTAATYRGLIVQSGAATAPEQAARGTESVRWHKRDRY